MIVELSFCINGLPGFHSALDEVARQVSLNYRGVTSGLMLTEEVPGQDAELRKPARDLKRVHEDAQVLAELGSLKGDDARGVLCPVADMHLDMHVHHDNVAA